MNASKAAEIHKRCDSCTEALIYFAIVFAPWAFGTTTEAAIRVMNSAGYLLGFLLSSKWLLRKFAGLKPPRCGGSPGPGARVTTRVVAIITVFLLSWSLLSAWNASATYSAVDLQFTYRPYISWLPHSFDANRSWSCFWNYLALACFFWAIRDWLLAKTPAEVSDASARTAIPVRLQRLLWILSVNGALVGLEGIIQKLEGGGKLLFLVQPETNKGPSSLFGPYAYRSNAAQFFNLVWPLSLGFWFLLHRRSRRELDHGSRHHLLLSCIMLMAACPLLSDSRAGAVMTAGLLITAAPILVFALRGESWYFRGALALFAALTLGLGLNMGWQSLRARMNSLDVDYLQRDQMYSTARKMADDYPWLGTGPGTFDPLFQLYRTSPEEYWPAQLHNDWLETQITFGRICFSLMLVALAACAVRWFAAGGITTHWAFPAFIGLALAGCLLHARFDFPFQVYSILFVFLLECALLLSIGKRSL